MDHWWIILFAIFAQFSSMIEAANEDQPTISSDEAVEIPVKDTKFPEFIEPLIPDGLNQSALSFEDIWAYLREGFDKVILERLKDHQKRVEEKEGKEKQGVEPTLKRRINLPGQYVIPGKLRPQNRANSFDSSVSEIDESTFSCSAPDPGSPSSNQQQQSSTDHRPGRLITVYHSSPSNQPQPASSYHPKPASSNQQPLNHQQSSRTQQNPSEYYAPPSAYQQPPSNQNPSKAYPTFSSYQRPVQNSKPPRQQSSSSLLYPSKPTTAYRSYSKPVAYHQRTPQAFSGYSGSQPPQKAPIDSFDPELQKHIRELLATSKSADPIRIQLTSQSQLGSAQLAQQPTQYSKPPGQQRSSSHSYHKKTHSNSKPATYHQRTPQAFSGSQQPQKTSIDSLDLELQKHIRELLATSKSADPIRIQLTSQSQLGSAQLAQQPAQNSKPPGQQSSSSHSYPSKPTTAYRSYSKPATYHKRTPQAFSGYSVSQQKTSIDSLDPELLKYIRELLAVPANPQTQYVSNYLHSLKSSVS